MSIKEKYHQIKELEKNMNEIIKVIEVFDPIRNNTTSNDYIDDGVEMVRIPIFKSWLIRTKKKISLRVKRRGDPYEPMELELSGLDVIDSISKVLCEKRDWYKSKIDEINNSN